MPLTLTTCLNAHDDDSIRSAPPTPDGLGYSITLPAQPTSPSIARTVTHKALVVHDLPELAAAAVQAASELTVTACDFTTQSVIYLSLRYRDEVLRITTYDHHPTHVNHRLARACDARRRDSLRLLACLTDTCGGSWGFAPSPEPGSGIRTWALLPRATAHAY
jgi:hypothetical protein